MVENLKETVKCQCGELCVVIEAPPVVQLVCHCQDCQEATGLPFVEGKFYEASACSSTGESIPAEMKGSSGYDKSYYACAKCHAPLYARVKALNGAWAVIANGSASFEPAAHIWTSEKAADVSIDASQVQSASGPPEDIRNIMLATFWGKN